MKLYESFVSNLKDSKDMLKEATNDELKLVDSLIQDLDANEGVYDIDDIIFAINHSGISQGAKDAAEEVLDNYSGIGGFLDQAEDEDEKEEILVDANNEAENAIMDFYKTDRDKLADLYHSINESDSKSVIDLARENDYLYDTTNMLQATEKIKNVDGSWFYQRPDSSGRDFFTDVEINSITDDEKNNLVDYCLDGLDSYNWGSYDLDTVNNTLSEELFDTLFNESEGSEDTHEDPENTSENIQDLIDFIEGNGWVVSEEDDNEYEIAQMSPAGQDFRFYVKGKTPGELIKNISEYAYNYDVDEEIDMWLEAKRNGTQGIPETRALVKDCEAIEAMLNDLVEEIKIFYKGDLSESEKLKESQTLKEGEFRIPESPSEGWGDDIKDFTQDFFDKVDAMGYEIHNAIRGSYGISGDTVNMLAMDFEDVSNMASNISEVLKRATVSYVSDEDFEESEKLKESTKFYNTEEPDCYLTLDKLQVVQNSAGKVLDVTTHGLVQNGDTTYVVVSDGDLNTVKAYSVDYGFPYVFKTKGNVNESEKSKGCTLTEDEKGYVEYLKANKNNIKSLSKYDQQVLQKDDIINRFTKDPDNDQLFSQLLNLNKQTANVDSSKEKNYQDYLRKVTEDTQKELSLPETEESVDDCTDCEFEIVITEKIGPSRYDSKIYDVVDDEERATDIVGELRARGIGATYRKVDKETKEEE